MRTALAAQAGRRQTGQVLVLFAGAIIALFAMLAVVIDISWYWSSALRLQRAADAAALAGVVYLPGDPSNAYATALAEARRNGFVPTADTNVTPRQDPNNPRRLIVTIDAPVGTFFARVLGINSFPASRTSEADYVLPVPMGSPLNYYGIGCLDTNEINGRTRPSCASGGDSNGPSGISTATSDDGTTGGGAQNQLEQPGLLGRGVHQGR